MEVPDLRIHGLVSASLRCSPTGPPRPFRHCTVAPGRIRTGSSGYGCQHCHRQVLSLATVTSLGDSLGAALAGPQAMRRQQPGAVPNPCRPRGMAGVRRYRFRALVTFDPAAREDRAPGAPSRTDALTVHACYLLQPLTCGEYFPAMISRDQEPRPTQPGGHAVVTIALADGEAEAFFAPGQRFRIWADGVVDHTIRAEGLVGYGIIRDPESSPLICDDGDRIRGTTAGPAHVGRPAAASAPSRR
jgi:hypothetical protein